MKTIFIKLVVVILATISTSLGAQSKKADSLYRSGVKKMTNEDTNKNTLESATMDFDLAIKLKSDYAEAYIKRGEIEFLKLKSVLDSINSEKIPASKSIKYRLDAFKLLRSSLKYFDKAHKYDKTNREVVDRMLEIYSLLGMSEEYEALRDSINK